MLPDLSSIRPVLLCGGSGTRLYPISTIEKPKPFLRLLSEYSMLQETALRLQTAKQPVILCNKFHADMVEDQLREVNISVEKIIKEPVSRNTAPAIALAAKYFEQDKEEILLFLPCDHKIENIKAFRSALEQGIRAAEQGKFVYFGEQPTSPDTDYGYIQAEKTDGSHVYKVQKFHEKPSLNEAISYIEDDYFWNTGILMVKALSLQKSFEQYAPTIWNVVKEISIHNVDPNMFSRVPDISIDYAILEKIPASVLVSVAMGWHDIGTLEKLKMHA